MDIQPEKAQGTGTDQYQIQQAGPQGPITPTVTVKPNEDC